MQVAALPKVKQCFKIRVSIPTGLRTGIGLGEVEDAQNLLIAAGEQKSRVGGEVHRLHDVFVLETVHLRATLCVPQLTTQTHCQRRPTKLHTQHTNTPKHIDIAEWGEPLRKRMAKGMSLFTTVCTLDRVSLKGQRC